jgi:hypothetical protein
MARDRKEDGGQTIRARKMAGAGSPQAVGRQSFHLRYNVQVKQY